MREITQGAPPDPPHTHHTSYESRRLAVAVCFSSARFGPREPDPARVMIL